MLNLKRMDFAIEDAASMIVVAPRSLGGLPPADFGEIFTGDGDLETSDLVAQGEIMPMWLRQDTTYNVRFILGDLTTQEEAEWTARVCWKLSVPCGQLLVTGTLSQDFEHEFSQVRQAVPGRSYKVGGYLEVPPGEYQVEVYSYPPLDLSGGWDHITDPESFGEAADLEPEKALDYFLRTRPNRKLPAWIEDENEPDVTSYIQFVVRLSPLRGNLEPPKLDEAGFIQWQFRKPEICPVGIRSYVYGNE